MGVQAAPELAISDDIDGPVLIGWLRPVILLPPGPHACLSDSEVEAVLAHELAHVRRGDYLCNEGKVVASSPDGTLTVTIGERHVGVGAFASERILVTA